MDAINALAKQIIQLQGKCRRPSQYYVLAVGAMVADLLRAASFNPVRSCFRELRSNSFTEKGVGYQPFTRALKDMKRHDFVTVEKGRRGWDGRPGLTTRIWITPKLTDFLASVGITAADRHRHFDYRRAAEDVPPIQLRASSRRIKDGKDKERGRLLKTDYSNPRVALYAGQIRQLNNFIGKQNIIGPEEYDLDDIALYRAFNLGDQPNHDYRKGGRIYASYQNMDRDNRKYITINSESIVEIDISACFLTLAHYFLNEPFKAGGDPYYHPVIPRDIVKSWVNITLSYSNYHSRWPSDTVSFLKKKKGIVGLSKRFPIKEIQLELRKTFTFMDDWCASSHDWSDLFFMESEIVMDALTTLAFNHKIVSLPIHDAIMVQSSCKEKASSVLRDCFINKTGIEPIIKIKT